MSYLVRDLATDRAAQVASPGEVHDLLTDWFATADLDQLAAVDELCLAIEQGLPGRNRLQVQLGIEVDEVK